jgi:hypothetical protein
MLNYFIEAAEGFIARNSYELASWSVILVLSFCVGVGVYFLLVLVGRKKTKLIEKEPCENILTLSNGIEIKNPSESDVRLAIRALVYDDDQHEFVILSKGELVFIQALIFKIDEQELLEEDAGDNIFYWVECQNGSVNLHFSLKEPLHKQEVEEIFAEFLFNDMEFILNNHAWEPQNI